MATASSASTSAPAAPAPACSTPSGRMLGTGQARHRALPRAGLDRRAVERRDLGARSAPPSAARSAQAGVAPGRTSRGIGFDATCSLVVLGPGGAPLPVGPSRGSGARHHRLDGPSRRRAGRAGSTPAATRCCAMSAARSRPRWRRRSCSGSRRTGRAVFDAAWQFFDLTDFLTWKATGSLARSSCTVTCKWTYLAHERRWDPDYFRDDRPRRARRRGLRPHRHARSSSPARRSAPA